MKLFQIVLFFILVIVVSCQNENITTNKTPIIEEPVPDSTEYFDSLYAPLKYPLDTFFLNRHNNGTFYGTVLFAERGRIIFQNAYGYANLTTKDTLTIDHTFQLASASKPFTAVAILQLYEKGKLKLDDDVRSYIPNFPYDSITIHQLLTHRSGLSQYTHFCDSPDSIWPDKNITISNKQVIEIMAKNLPIVNYPPNHTHYYCNTNYLLLASIVENVTGQSFGQYLKSNIFEKAGMTHTVVYSRDNKDQLKIPTVGYHWNFNPAGDIYLNGVVGDKGVYSNVGDMLKFDQALYQNGLLLKKETMKLAVNEHNETQNNGQNYGYGFRLMNDSIKGKIVYHTGWWEGNRTYFIRVPEHQQTIIVLSHIKKGPFFNILELVDLLPK